MKINIELLEASKNGNKEVILNCLKSKLFRKRADVNTKDYQGQTPLHHAISSGSEEIVMLLISKGADVNAKNKYGTTPLFYAVSEGYIKIVELLISNGADLNVKGRLNSDREPALSAAIISGKIEIAKLLIEKGADVNSCSDEVHFTPLMHASNDGYFDIVKMLLERGADVKRKNSGNYTAIQFAFREGHKEIVDLLKSAGAEQPLLGKLYEGWIVWMDVTFNSTPELEKALKEANSKRDEIIIHGHIWTVYNNEKTTNRIGQLLIKAGVKDPGIKKVKCYENGMDPRINKNNARTMENGWVIEYIE